MKGFLTTPKGASPDFPGNCGALAFLFPQRPKTLQDAPKTRPDAPKTLPRRPPLCLKMRLRCSKTRPRRPKTPQDTPTSDFPTMFLVMVMIQHSKNIAGNPLLLN